MQLGNADLKVSWLEALTELTGQAFHVVKSGHQEGSDLRSAPHNLFKIGLEGKLYKSKTPLPLDSLKHKITDASTSLVPVDLWLLATTRRVDVSDRAKSYTNTVKLLVLVFSSLIIPIIKYNFVI